MRLPGSPHDVEFYTFTMDSQAEETATSGEEATADLELAKKSPKADLESCQSQTGIKTGSEIRGITKTNYKSLRK